MIYLVDKQQRTQHDSDKQIRGANAGINDLVSCSNKFSIKAKKLPECHCGKILPRVPLPHNTTLISVTTLNC